MKVTLDSRIDDALSGMREALSEEEARVEAAKTIYDEARERVTRLRRAIEALDPSPKEDKAVSENGNGAGSSNVWTPGDKSRTKVLAAMQGRGKMTVPAISKASGVSSETVRRTMEYERAQPDPRVRFAGVSANNAKMYEALS